MAMRDVQDSPKMLLEAVEGPRPKYEMEISVGRWLMVNGNPAIVFKSYTIHTVPDIATEIGKILKMPGRSVAVIECFNILRDDNGVRSVSQWRFDMR